MAALVSYTWAKSIDDASNFFSSAGDPNFPQNSYNVRAERGRSNFDVRHRLSVSYSYDLPFGRGKRYLADDGLASKLLGGWQSFGVVTWQSGRPFTVALLSEIDNSGTGRSILGFGANDRPNLVGNPELSSHSPSQWFNTAAFAFPAPGTFGSPSWGPLTRAPRRFRQSLASLAGSDPPQGPSRRAPAAPLIGDACP